MLNTSNEPCAWKPFSKYHHVMSTASEPPAEPISLAQQAGQSDSRSHVTEPEMLMLSSKLSSNESP
jgi:hypothetical protein